MTCKSRATFWLLLCLFVSAVAGDGAAAFKPVAILPRRKNANRHGYGSSLIKSIHRGGSDISKPPPSLPTLATYRQFAIPCLGLWIAQPLLSLVDTAFVGLSGESSSSARQLAALGPATTFFDGATYLFAFLNVATTNLYASACAQKGEQSDKAESVVRTAAKVGFNSGLGLMVFLLAFSRPLLGLYIGTCVLCCFVLCILF
jgi:hypothetical protein